MSGDLTITTGADTPRYLLLRLAGVFDGRFAAALKARCAPDVTRGRRVILNLAGVAMITSSGIGALLAIVEEHGQEFGKVRIAAPSEAVTSVIRVLNLDQFLIVDDTEDQAIRASEAA